MGNLNDFIEFLDTQVKNHSIYVWAAQGQGANIISESWIRKMETSEKNAQRAINFWKKQVAAGYGSILRAFDCSGLGMTKLQAMFGYPDMTADEMYKKLCKKINKSDLKRGDWVFKVNNDGKATHVGYVTTKDLQVTEDKGRDDGVVTRPLSEGAWNAYGRPKCFEDEILAQDKKEIKVGDLCSIAANATWYDGSHIPDWVKKENWYVYSTGPNDRVVINENEAHTKDIRSPISSVYLTVVQPTPKPAPTFTPYKVKVTAKALNYRAGPGTSYKVNGVITDQGIYTIVDEAKDSTGQTWGKLKSGVGWISLKYTKKV